MNSQSRMVISAVFVLAVAACTKDAVHSGDSSPPEDASPARPVTPETTRSPARADDDAELPDTQPPSEVPSMSLQALLGLAGDGPPGTIDRAALGAPYEKGDGSTHVVEIDEEKGCIASVEARSRDESVVDHIQVELSCDEMLPESQWREWRESVEARVAKAWGKPQVWHGYQRWAGAHSQLFLVEWNGFLRGYPSLIIDVFSSRDDQVCGSKDGFARFFKRFKRAAAAGSIPPVMLAPPDDDSEVLCTDDYAACAKEVAKAIQKSGGKAICNVSRRAYSWATVQRIHGGDYFLFRRVKGAWKAIGPLSVSHDVDLFGP